MSVQVTIKDLLEAGVHFGHQTSRWNPKMKPYIFGARNGIYIIDLQKTVGLAKDALTFVQKISAQGKKILFVGTKLQAKDTIKEQAERSANPYVVERWLGGTLTNYSTIQACITSLERIEDKINSGLADQMPKKERATLDKEYLRLTRNLGGIRHLKELPGALFVIDPSKEHIAVAEARCLNIPVIAVTDTNCDPDSVDYVIPGNDDALKSIKMFSSAVSDAYLEGSKLFEERVRALHDKREIEAKHAATAAQERESTDKASGGSRSKGAKAGTTTDREGRSVNVEVRRNVSKENKAAE